MILRTESFIIVSFGKNFSVELQLPDQPINLLFANFTMYYQLDFPHFWARHTSGSRVTAHRPRARDPR